MNEEQQSIIALLIVAITALVFLFRYLRQRRTGGCSTGCGCSISKPTVQKNSRQLSSKGIHQ
jgi:hypothetical protein